MRGEWNLSMSSESLCLCYFYEFVCWVVSEAHELCGLGIIVEEGVSREIG